MKFSGANFALNLRIASTVLAFLAAAAYARSQSVSGQNLTARISQMAKAYLAQRPHCGLVVGVLRQGARTVQGFGETSAAHPAAPDGDTLFEIGSITKVFTGLLLARLCEEGVVRLDQPIDELLPPGTQVPPQPDGAITLGELATHTSGLPRLPGNLIPMDISNPYAKYTMADLFAGLGAVKPMDKPGHTSTYSNYGFGLLGQLIALKAGEPYKQLIEKRICIPLHLGDTQFDPSPAQRIRLAEGHSPGGATVPYWDQDAMAPAGGLKSTVDDLLTLLEANFDSAPADLAPALALARKPHFTQSGGNGVGLGWQISAAPGGARFIWHNGGTGGFVCFAGFDETARVAVVILSSSGDAMAGKTPTDAMGMELLRIATAATPR